MSTTDPRPPERDPAGDLTTPERDAASQLGMSPAHYAALKQVRNLDEYRAYQERVRKGEIK